MDRPERGELDAPPGAPGGRDARRDPSQPVVQPPRYGRYVALLAIGILVLITVNTITTKPNGNTAIAPGVVVPPLAVPLATGNLSGEAAAATPSHPGGAGDVPACKER